MRTVIQRVARARVVVEGRVVGEIGRGLLALVSCEARDTEKDAAWTAEKVANLRVFEDAAGKMNLAVNDLPDEGRGVLLVPNFTVAGDAQKGRRPSFDNAMRPELAGPLFERVALLTAAQGVRVATGVFRAHMLVDLVNDGPVTLVVTSPA
jgi:D-tyrosyl-tRNA(Tyr) deacylase